MSGMSAIPVSVRQSRDSLGRVTEMAMGLSPPFAAGSMRFFLAYPSDSLHTTATINISVSSRLGASSVALAYDIVDVADA
jgi:hypothetical protein